jgi:hypothetical protein
MSMNRQSIKEKLADELKQITDKRVVSHIQSLLVEPISDVAGWCYTDDKFHCWKVFKHEASKTGILYCEEFYRPGLPWLLVCLPCSDERLVIGDDSSWFGSFLDAYFESFAPTELPIWRVFKGQHSPDRVAISKESGWEETWSRVMEMRESDPSARYDCDHSIAY